MANRNKDSNFCRKLSMGAIVIEEKVRIPAWVVDLDSFRLWAQSDEFPAQGWFSHIRGELWVDVSMEAVAHNQIKGEYGIVLGGLSKKSDLGKYFHDRMLLTNPDADLSTEPDGMFVSWQTLRSKRVVLAEGDETTELRGSPDMAMEVISAHFVQKDTDVLREAYWRAGIREYWLVDSRGQRASFAILRHSGKGYVAVRAQGGWLKSAVLGKVFRLSQRPDPVGGTEYTLEAR